jgi:Glycosyl transferases group 1
MAKKDITIVSSMVGAGLEREYRILADLFKANDMYTMGLHYTDLNSQLHPSHIMISLEVIAPRTLSISKENWFVPNSEWYDTRNDQFLPHFSKILCKTHDCYDIWSKKVGADKCVYTSFEARDLYNADTPRELRFLHIAGKSEHKNTEAVLNAWALPHPGEAALPPLTVIARAPKIEAPFVNRRLDDMFPDKNVTYNARVEDSEIVRLMNSHQVHVIPSMYEGFGHIIHEGLGCGAFVITTDARPMNTYEGIARECLIPVCNVTPYRLAQLNQVSAQAVNVAVRRAAQLMRDPNFAQAHFNTTQRAFADNREFFRRTILEMANAVK